MPRMLRLAASEMAPADFHALERIVLPLSGKDFMSHF